MSQDPFLKLLDGRATSDQIKVILCFDDGYAASSQSTADLFEKHGLSAVFAVLTEEWNLQGLGNWELWNRLQERGHFIHPHGPFHRPQSNPKRALGRLHLTESTAAIERCFNDFTANLKEFSAERVCFHYPHNKGNRELNDWLLKRVAAVRLATGRCAGYNTPEHLASRILNCTTHAHESPLELVEKAIEANPCAWIVALHGVDAEGWGPVPQGNLDTLLTHIAAEPRFDFLNRR